MTADYFVGKATTIMAGDGQIPSEFALLGTPEGTRLVSAIVVAEKILS